MFIQDFIRQTSSESKESSPKMQRIREEDMTSILDDLSAKEEPKVSKPLESKEETFKEKPTNFTPHSSENEKSLPVQARIQAPPAPSPSVESQVCEKH